MMTLQMDLDEAILVRRLLRDEQKRLSHSLEYSHWNKEDDEECKRAERLLEKFE